MTTSRSYDSRRFDSLPFRDKLDVLYDASAPEKRNLILSSADAPRLVRSFAAESLFYTLKEIGLEDSAELLALASGEQICGLVDLDCWKKDRFDMPTTLDWLDVMAEAGPRTLGEFLNSVDLEFLVLLLTRFIRVYREEDPDEPPELHGPEVFDLDAHYKIVFTRWNARAPVVRQLVEELYERDYSYFVTVMEEVYWAVGSELEEASFQRRNSRLQDRGFPDYYEALAVFRPLRPGELPERLHPLGRGTTSDDREDVPLGLSLIVPDNAGSFFAEVLNGAFRGEEADQLRQEMAFLTNRVMVAEGVDYASRESVTEAIRLAHDTVNLGLEVLSGVDRRRAATMLGRHYVQHVFRFGCGLLFDLRRAARGAQDDLGDGPAPSFLDTPFREALGGFLRPHPRFFNGITAPGAIDWRAFATFDDLESAREILEAIRSIPEVCQRLAGIRFEDLASLRPARADEFRLSAALLTAFAHVVLGGRPALRPFAGKELRELHERIDAGGRLRPEIRERFFSLSGRRDRFLDFCLGRLEEELLPLDAIAGIDPRFVTCLMIESR